MDPIYNATFAKLRNNMLESIIAGIATLIIAPLAVWIVQRKFQEHQEHLQAKKSDEIVVSRITERSHEDCTGVVDLYTKIFDDDGTNYNPEELLEFLTKPVFKDRHLPDIENIVLVAKHRDTVVGFMFCHFYPSRRNAIVSYYAIDRRDEKARLSAAKGMAVRLYDLLSEPSRPCDLLFFDTQNPDSRLNRVENRERRARPALFKLTAESLGLHAYKFHFDYVYPRVSLDPEAREYPFTLLCVPMPGFTLPVPVPRETLLEYLRFIYEDCYGDVYPVSDPRFREHHTYLNTLSERYAATLPDFIYAD